MVATPTDFGKMDKASVAKMIAVPQEETMPPFKLLFWGLRAGSRMIVFCGAVADRLEDGSNWSLGVAVSGGRVATCGNYVAATPTDFGK